MPIKKDWKALGDALEGGVKELLNGLIDGSISDLDGPVRVISARLVFAAKRGREDLVDECRDQLAVLIIEQELAIRKEASEFWEVTLGIGLNALVNGAIGGIGSLKVV